MRYELILAPEAVQAFGALRAYERAEVRDALERHLRHEPTRVSKSRIKRLRGLSQPQYRLRVGEVRVFYDVTREVVQVLAIVTKAEAAAGSLSTGRPMRRVALAEVKDDLSRFLRLAESEEILITRHGKPAGVLIGFESEDDWFDYRLEHHPEFLRRVAEARSAFDAGAGVRLEDVPS